eukprot:CCRYP_002839-RC/>CCRYP_002839-RC protein AED:0.47 eAED:0.47 QI:0/-1/0/1/-1/0/1/0/67
MVKSSSNRSVENFCSMAEQLTAPFSSHSAPSPPSPPHPPPTPSNTHVNSSTISLHKRTPFSHTNAAT